MKFLNIKLKSGEIKKFLWEECDWTFQGNGESSFLVIRDLSGIFMFCAPMSNIEYFEGEVEL